jgi:hypothetical protein
MSAQDKALLYIHHRKPQKHFQSAILLGIDRRRVAISLVAT